MRMMMNENEEEHDAECPDHALLPLRGAANLQATASAADPLDFVLH